MTAQVHRPRLREFSSRREEVSRKMNAACPNLRVDLLIKPSFSLLAFPSAADQLILDAVYYLGSRFFGFCWES
jgi:hypothetical protein